MSIDPRLEEGIELFNRQEFFECHEVIEDLWLATQDEYKDLYKGIIQSAVALYHLDRGNMSGAHKLFHTSQKYLKKYSPEAFGIQVQKLMNDMKNYFEQKSEQMPKIKWIKED